MESDNGDSPNKHNSQGLFASIMKTIRHSQNEDEDLAQELQSIVNDGCGQGTLDANEAEMIANICEFGDKEASDIMTIRKNVDGLDEQTTLQEAIDYIVEATNSRFPVFRNDLDDIVGVLLIKDALKFYIQGIYNDTPIGEIPDLLRKAVFIPETRKINPLFRSMQSQKIHMVIVIDEYGQTVGLITMEDILEEIVGNIQDEFDEEEVMIRKEADGYIIQGMAPLEDVCEALHMPMPDEEIDTMNGLLISLLDRIPEEDEKPVIEYGDYQFQVLQMDNRMIKAVKAVKCSQDKEKDTDQKK